MVAWLGQWQLGFKWVSRDGELLQRDNLRPHVAHLARMVPCQHGRGGHRPSDGATTRQGRHDTGPPQQRCQGKVAR
jgi:hypothetical protein